MLEIAQNIANQIKKYTNLKPECGIILGSGWGEVINNFSSKVVIAYSDLIGMSTCTVKGHSGNFVIGNLNNKTIIAMQGRFHLYEGKTTEEVCLPILIMKLLGITNLIITNAAGGLNKNYKIGDIMLLDDHINFTSKNPLINLKLDYGAKFIDMTKVYNKELNAKLEFKFKNSNINIHKGTYLQVLGPSYETPAEIRAFSILGADAVGMSTVIESIFAKYINLDTIGISCITNMASGISNTKLDHKDVLDITFKNKDNFINIIDELIKLI